MKKKYIIIAAVYIIVVGFAWWLLHSSSEVTPETVGTFDLNDYRAYAEKYSSSVVLGEVHGADNAAFKADDFLIGIYGNSVKKERPYSVYHDPENKAWFVTSTVPDENGCVSHVILDEVSGKVLAVWHGK